MMIGQNVNPLLQGVVASDIRPLVIGSNIGGVHGFALVNGYVVAYTMSGEVIAEAPNRWAPSVQFVSGAPGHPTQRDYFLHVGLDPDAPQMMQGKYMGFGTIHQLSFGNDDATRKAYGETWFSNGGIVAGPKAPSLTGSKGAAGVGGFIILLALAIFVVLALRS